MAFLPTFAAMGKSTSRRSAKYPLVGDKNKYLALERGPPHFRRFSGSSCGRAVGAVRRGATGRDMQKYRVSSAM